MVESVHDFEDVDIFPSVFDLFLYFPCFPSSICHSLAFLINSGSRRGYFRCFFLTFRRYFRSFLVIFCYFQFFPSFSLFLFIFFKFSFLSLSKKTSFFIPLSHHHRIQHRYKHRKSSVKCCDWSEPFPSQYMQLNSKICAAIALELLASYTSTGKCLMTCK